MYVFAYFLALSHEGRIKNFLSFVLSFLKEHTYVANKSRKETSSKVKFDNKC